MAYTEQKERPRQTLRYILVYGKLLKGFRVVSISADKVSTMQATSEEVRTTCSKQPGLRRRREDFEGGRHISYLEEGELSLFSEPGRRSLI
jgi:hypothetical protein